MTNSENSDADRAMRAQPGAAYAELPALFREALAWGMTYGPEIPAHQWDEMRESMVKHYTDRAARGQAPAPAAVAGPVAAWITPEGDRVVTEATMAGARKDGGAMLSSMRPYTVALVRAAAPTTQAAPRQEAQEPVAYVHVPHFTVEGKVRPVVSFEKYQQDYADGIYSTRIPLYTAPQPAPAAQGDAEDAARYRYLRDGDWREHEKLESVIRLQLNALWDETIDAARSQAKEGAIHE